MYVKDWYYTQKWYKFKKQIFKRDSHICRDCGSKENLRVHHIERATIRPDLFFEEINCLTLCNDCHEKRHQVAQGNYIYNENGFYDSNPADMVLCDCGRFYHETKYRMCYECYLNWKKDDYD